MSRKAAIHLGVVCVGRKLGVQSRHLVDRVDDEPVWLLRPDLGDVFAGREPAKRLELPPSEWSIDYDSLDQGRDDECRRRSTSIDIAEMQTAEGKLYLFVDIDRTSKFAVTQLVDKADRRAAWEFLEYLLKAVRYRIHTILTDIGIQFAEQPRNRNTAWSRQMRST